VRRGQAGPSSLDVYDAGAAAVVAPAAVPAPKGWHRFLRECEVVRRQQAHPRFLLHRSTYGWLCWCITWQAPFCLYSRRHGFNALQAALAFFLVLNVLICFWEISLGIHIMCVQISLLRKSQPEQRVCVCVCVCVCCCGCVCVYAVFRTYACLPCFHSLTNFLRRSYIRETFKSLQATYGNDRMRCISDLFFSSVSLKQIISTKFWSQIWASYSLYDPSYSNQEA